LFYGSRNRPLRCGDMARHDAGYCDEALA